MYSTDYFSIIVSVLGGLAFFLYGMHLLGTGLEKASGGRLERTLEKMSSNIFKAVLFGALVTAAVQSSSATTVIVVGLVNANIIKLKQAIGVIMGANIGTTITAHILSMMDIQSDNFIINLLKPTSWAPIVSIIGIILFMAGKKAPQKDLGQILLGFGILFFGMFQMSDAVAPLEEVPEFIALFQNFSNPVLGVLAGAGVTAIIQSSAASIGILQALTSTGQITFASAIPIILGQNIGTCITPIMAAIGASKNAKRSAFVHLSFNIIGTLLFLFGVYAFQYTIGFSFWNNPITSNDIANFHSIFNITVTILLIPFGNYLAKLATKILPEKAEEKEHHKHLKYIKSVDTRVDATFGTSAINLQNLRNEIQRMLEMARVNVEESFDAFLAGSSRFLGDVDKREDYIDYLNKEISRAAAKMMAHETNVKASKNIGSYLDMTSNIERIGDHAVNICDYTKLIEEKHIVFSDDAKQQMEEMKMICEKMFHNISKVPEDTQEWLQKVHDSENFIDQKTEEFYESHLERINRGECNDEACIIFSEMLTDFERIGDHTWNVAKQMAKIIERG